MERVIVERRLSVPVTPDELRASACSAQACYALYRVRHLRSAISLDGLRVICEYEAPDAESVRRAQLQAKVPFEAVWTALADDASA